MKEQRRANLSASGLSGEGSKRLFSSQRVVKEVGSFIFYIFKKRDGLEPKVDLEDLDKAISLKLLAGVAELE
ncbi:MAG: hypothetical protein QXH91_08550 [Candidatus Bathyarchaeia archaeon]